MANVTDYAFRSMIAAYGKPDVMWNEFVSADGLDSPGREKLLVDLKFSEKERPIIAQLFTGHPEAMKKASALCAELGFDGIDINMGCPDRAVEKQGGGAAHIKEPKIALQVLEAAREGWKQARLKKGNKEKWKDSEKDADMIPVSIKTRIGYNKIDFSWLRLLLEQRLPALTVHLRTRKEMSDVPAHWELMPEIIQLRDEVQADMSINERTLLIGNGDVATMLDAREKCKKYGCEGVMIGRGIFGTPWLFSGTTTKTPEERLKIMLEHTKIFEKTFKGIKNFAVMKKHFKAYVSGWDGAKELRVKLMETTNYKEVKKVVEGYMLE